MPPLKGTEESLSCVQCFLYLVSSSINVSIFHSIGRDTSGQTSYRVIALDKGMIHALGGMEWSSVRFHHATRNNEQFKTYELFISGIFHLIFLGCSRLWIINHKCETMNKRDDCIYVPIYKFLTLVPYSSGNKCFHNTLGIKLIFVS